MQTNWKHPRLFSAHASNFRGCQIGQNIHPRRSVRQYRSSQRAFTSRRAKGSAGSSVLRSLGLPRSSARGLATAMVCLTQMPRGCPFRSCSQPPSGVRVLYQFERQPKRPVSLGVRPCELLLWVVLSWACGRGCSFPTVSPVAITRPEGLVMFPEFLVFQSGFPACLEFTQAAPEEGVKGFLAIPRVVRRILFLSADSDQLPPSCPPSSPQPNGGREATAEPNSRVAAEGRGSGFG